MRRFLTVLIAATLSIPISAQTPPATHDGGITGHVVDAVSGKPVSAAIVGVAEGPDTPVLSSSFSFHGRARILTGADGRFAFGDLPAGSFTVTAAKAGYAEGASGRRRPGGLSQVVAITAAQRTVDVTVRVWKYGAIAGTVTDEAGEALVGVQLRVLARTVAGGARRFVPTGPPAFTDDRGAYRFSNLAAGDYLVVVSAPTLAGPMSSFAAGAQTGKPSRLPPPGRPDAIQLGDEVFGLPRGTPIPPPPIAGRLRMYPTTFFPSATVAAQAATITLAPGEERTSIDLQIEPVPTARVSGAVTSTNGLPGVQLRLVPSGFDEVVLEQDALKSTTDARGEFAFPAVPPGQYRLRATARLDQGTPERSSAWLDQRLTVSGSDIDALVATLRPGLQVTARLEFQGAADAPRKALFISAPFALDPADGTTGVLSATSGIVGERGITLTDFAPGRYVVRVPESPPGWMFKSAMLNGVDVSETPFELTRDVQDLIITFTDKWSGIGGTVRLPEGNPDPAAAVVIFPTNADGWRNYGSNPRRLRIVRTNAKGEFGISSLPAGDYYVAAMPDEQSEDWRDAKTLEALARVAVTVIILEGEHRMIDLRTREVPR